MTQYKYHGIPIFLTSKGNGNCFEKSGIRKIEGGIESHLFYIIMVLSSVYEKQAGCGQGSQKKPAAGENRSLLG